MPFILVFLLVSTSNSPASIATITKLERFHAEKDLGKKLDLLNEFAKKRDFMPLFVVLNDGTIFEHYAAHAVCNNLTTHETILFCESLPKGTKKWESAIICLSERSKNEVIDYLTGMVQNLDPVDRAFLYEMFTFKGWPELAEIAKMDIHCTKKLHRLNAPLKLGSGEITVGAIAAGYVNEMKRLSDTEPSEDDR